MARIVVDLDIPTGDTPESVARLIEWTLDSNGHAPVAYKVTVADRGGFDGAGGFVNAGSVMPLAV